MTIPGNTVSGSGNDPILGQSFFLDLQGAVTGYFTQCSGLSSSNEVIVNKSTDSTGRTRIRKIPGPLTLENITLSKGITSSLELWNWIQAIADGKINDSRKDGTISLCDQAGEVVAQWTLVAAWPVRVTGPSLNADGGQVGLEELELAIEGFTRTQ
jgi:phage tail-like protein